MKRHAHRPICSGSGQTRGGHSYVGIRTSHATSSAYIDLVTVKKSMERKGPTSKLRRNIIISTRLRPPTYVRLAGFDLVIPDDAGVLFEGVWRRAIPRGGGDNSESTV